MKKHPQTANKEIIKNDLLKEHKVSIMQKIMSLAHKNCGVKEYHKSVGGGYRLKIYLKLKI